ncbi:MAG: FAD-dependent oxidoreductase, partial [Deltaproteobacteria bacterium]|nr:FAD-dependent oxidoreductase [Deltaproteobacteria bacterium]
DWIEVYLDDGRYIDTDILVNALGVAARTDFLSGTNIKINKGVLVDNRMRTNIEGIYAAGDVAEAPDFFTYFPAINAILPSAVKQGKIAGANMAGEDNEYEGDISMNVFNFLGNKAISMGVTSSRCNDIQMMQEEDKQKNSFKKLAFKNSRFVGVNLLNIDVDPGILLYLIKNRVEIDSCKDKLFEKPGDTSRWLMLQNEKGETATK